jgi:5-methylcytosine-specific restriction protein A
VEHGGEWFVFPTLGPSRTGHDYGNKWQGERLLWFGKTGSRRDHDSIRSMTGEEARVHLFTREHARDPFTYHGLVRAVEVRDTVPVEVVWELADVPATDRPMPEEVPPGEYTEGSTKTVTIDAYERDRNARRACVAHWGYRCAVCSVLLSDRYGKIAKNYIHVHHLKPLAEAGGPRQVDPVADLRPVCPNCHAVIHLAKTPLTIEAAKELLR